MTLADTITKRMPMSGVLRIYRNEIAGMFLLSLLMNGVDRDVLARYVRDLDRGAS